MAPVLLINGEFMQLKQHHKYLVIMSDGRLKQSLLILFVTAVTQRLDMFRKYSQYVYLRKYFIIYTQYRRNLGPFLPFLLISLHNLNT